MGKFITLPGVNPATSRPKIDTIDPVLPANIGALLLIEPGHPIMPWAPGVPGVPGTQGAVLPNLAAKQAASLMGIAETDARLYLARTSEVDLPTPVKVKTERTAKGGFHVIFSQTQNDTGNAFVGITGATNGSTGGDWQNHFLRTYFAANSQEVYKNSMIYVSMWTRITKAWRAGSQGTDILTIADNSSTTGNYRQRFANGNLPTFASPPTSVGGLLEISGGHNDLVAVGSGQPGIATVALKRFANASRGYRGTLPAAPWITPFYIGNQGTVNTYLTARGASPSAILYRVYMEDLNVSGRTSAQVDALDSAEYIKAFSPGGRYYNDTYTDPNTLA